MEAPVQRVVVLPLAGRAHGELRHGGLWPVIRNAARNGEARPAVGAVQERISIAAVVGVQQFPLAIRAGGRIRGNSRADPAHNLTGNDMESCTAGLCPGKGQFAHHNRVDARQRRRLAAQTHEKRGHSRWWPLNLDGHTIGIVSNQPRQALFDCQPIDKRTKPHPLHDAAHQRRTPLRRLAGPLFRMGSFSHNRASRRNSA